jgi:hypothetical protein
MTRGPKRFLLPHERWLAGWILGSQQKRRTTAVAAMEKRYGPDGMVWLDASLANGLFLVIFAVAVFVAVFAHPRSTSSIAGYLMVVAAVFWALNIVRLIQAARAGRKFRREGH